MLIIVKIKKPELVVSENKNDKNGMQFEQSTPAEWAQKFLI